MDNTTQEERTLVVIDEIDGRMFHKFYEKVFYSVNEIIKYETDRLLHHAREDLHRHLLNVSENTDGEPLWKVEQEKRKETKRFIKKFLDLLPERRIKIFDKLEKEYNIVIKNDENKQEQ